jgi:hypothetical protein
MQICLNNAPPLFRAPCLTNTRLVCRRRSSLFRPGCRAVRLRDLSMMPPNAIHFLAEAIP